MVLGHQLLLKYAQKAHNAPPITTNGQMPGTNIRLAIQVVMPISATRNPAKMARIATGTRRQNPGRAEPL